MGNTFHLHFLGKPVGQSAPGFSVRLSKHEALAVKVHKMNELQYRGHRKTGNEPASSCTSA
jgi:hypothetical protein